MKWTSKTTMLAATVILLASMQSFADIVVDSGGIMGSTSNIGIPPAGRTDININNNTNTAGSVGQFDWNQFTPAQQSNLNYNFESIQQTMIQRIEGGKTQDILNKVTPSAGVNNSEIVQSGKSFSPLEQTYIHRVEGGKTQEVLNKVTPAPETYTSTISKNGDVIINNQNSYK